MSRYNPPISLSTVLNQTALVRVHNDILVALNKPVTVLCFYCQTCLLPSTLWITTSSFQDCTLNTLSLAQLLNGFAPALLITQKFALIEGCRSQSFELKCGVLKVLSLDRFCMYSTQHHWPTFYDSTKCNLTFAPMTLNCIFLSLQTTTWNLPTVSLRLRNACPTMISG